MLSQVRGPGTSFIVWAIGDAIFAASRARLGCLPIPRVAVLERHTRVTRIGLSALEKASHNSGKSGRRSCRQHSPACLCRPVRLTRSSAENVSALSLPVLRFGTLPVSTRVV